MNRPTIVLEVASRRRFEGFLIPLAGGRLWTDVPIEPAAQDIERARRPERPEPRPEVPSELVYDGPGLVDGGIRRIRSLIGSDGARRVLFEDGESFWIATSGDRIRRLPAGDPGHRGTAPAREASEAPTVSRTFERALGGPLALALATLETYLLHASAVAGARGVVALTGTPGRGKSTLAAAARRFPELSLAHVADDQLPVRLTPLPRALPHFPQLKLRAGEGYAASAASELPLRALVEITHAVDQRGVAIDQMNAAEACLALARATAASRLFDPTLLERHFEQCALASRALAVFRLRFPSGLDRLREPLAALADLA